MFDSLASAQYAGGGGIQGLQRGTRKRPGLVILTEKRYCQTCQATRLGDFWTGEIKSANSAANIPVSLVQRILEVYAYTDAIEQRKRAAHELVIDHRFPMERWGDNEPPHLASMSESEIKQKFQLLKKDASGNHNLLKSRSCERCIKTGKRGTPFGIKFWYERGEDWPCGCHHKENPGNIGKRFASNSCHAPTSQSPSAQTLTVRSRC